MVQYVKSKVKRLHISLSHHSNADGKRGFSALLAFFLRTHLDDDEVALNTCTLQRGKRLEEAYVN